VEPTKLNEPVTDHPVTFPFNKSKLCQVSPRSIDRKKMKNEVVPNKVLFVKTAASPLKLFFWLAFLSSHSLATKNNTQNATNDNNNNQLNLDCKKNFFYWSLLILKIEVVPSLSKVN
jgi:hypothetical protein